MSNQSPRPRILLITRNLPPLVGGMERLNWHLADELSKVAEVRVVGPEGASALAPTRVQVREAPLKPLWKFLLRARVLARREAKVWRPDLIMAGSGLTAPVARSAAHMCAARTAVYVHGLDVAVRHLAYRTIWLSAIRHMDRVIANSNATVGLCRNAGVDPTRIGIVHPGVDMVVEPHSLRERGRGEGKWTRRSEGISFRDRHKLGDRPILLSVGRLSARKGLREFVTHVLPRIVAEHPDIMLLIVGDAPSDALHAEAQTPGSIHAAATRAGVAENLSFLGTITNYEELGAVYHAADVHVFPVREISGDPEGFGMVAVEAAAHGLPTVAFATGGIVDAIADGRSGRLVAPGDYVAFGDAVTYTLRASSSLRDSCVTFAKGFAWPVFGARVAEELRLLDREPISSESPR